VYYCPFSFSENISEMNAKTTIVVAAAAAYIYIESRSLWGTYLIEMKVSLLCHRVRLDKMRFDRSLSNNPISISRFNFSWNIVESVRWFIV